MDFGFTKEQKMLRDSIREFMAKECPREYVRELDEKGEFPFELYKKMAKLDWFGLPFPEEYGGSGLGAVEFAIKGMLPKNALGRKMYKKLKVYASAEHPHAAQQPKTLEL